MVDILSLVLHHDEQAVLYAVELALEAGVPTKTHILNLLHRLIDGKPGNVEVETGNDSFRFKASAASGKQKKETPQHLTKTETGGT